ncbi:hypothetical protein BDZ45DRAFT_321194 [Acephala macrosclerotiorum]|nr:hypothetical protein BDZ45DRAFT_321194 [Acephala macrosclerotiorum]
MSPHLARSHYLNQSNQIIKSIEYITQIDILAVALSQSSRQCSLSECNSRGLPLAFLLYDMTWPMEAMPHNDIASFCLAALWHMRRGKDLGELFCAAEKATCAICLDLG